MALAKLKKLIEPGRRARILVVDDSTVMRRLIAFALDDDPHLEVVGTAQNGREAVEKLAKLAPDAITLDIEMPEMNGLEALRHIRKLSPQVRVVMLSTTTERGKSATLEALSMGADDYVTKIPAGKSVETSTAQLRSDLTSKLKQFFTFAQPAVSELAATTEKRPASLPARALHPDVETQDGDRTQSRPILRAVECVPRIVVIGISTGGPPALARILPEIPKDFPIPILIVQHMPALFTKSMCERLQELSQLTVREASHGEVVKPGAILIAPGDFHMRVQVPNGERQARVALDQGPPENSCRPAVDVLFESVASVYGGATVAAVLTGMGQDGLRGAKLLRSAGATILAQDEETSAVWGMPRAIAEANLAHAVLPLGDIVPQILRSCRRPARRDESGSQESL